MFGCYSFICLLLFDFGGLWIVFDVCLAACLQFYVGMLWVRLRADKLWVLVIVGYVVGLWCYLLLLVSVLVGCLC